MLEGIIRIIPILRRIAYPVPVTVFSERAGKALQINHDRARRIEEGEGEAKIEKYQLLSNGEKFKPPEFNTFYVGKGGKPHLYLYEAEKYQYYPMNLVRKKVTTKRKKDGEIVKTTKKTKDFEVEDKGTKAWAINEIKKTSEMFKEKETWFEKYGLYTVIVTVIVLQLITLWVSWKQLGSVAGKILSAVQQAKQISW